MRLSALLAASMLAIAPIATIDVAHADGIERPHRVHHPRPHRRPPPVYIAPTPAPLPPPGPETVTLSPSFFTGGVGTDIGTEFVGGGGRTVVVGGGGAIAIAFASASARASAGGRFGGGGGHHGGGGCGCH